MAGGSNIVVQLPEGVRPTPLDAELVKAACAAVAALRWQPSEGWVEALRLLEAEGWSVQWGLCWQAEAKRGGDFERASGKTLEQAFAELAQLARLDTVCHCP